MVRCDKQAVLDEDIICPDENPLHCYPKMFIPSDSWQEVKDGQIIPEGLDIRMGIGESLKREARIPGSDSNSDDDIDEKKAVAVMPEDDKLEQGNNEYLEFHQLARYVTDAYENGKLNTEYQQLMTNLERLAELCSDRKFGLDMIKQVKPLLALTGLYEDSNLWNVMTKEQIITIQDVSTRCVSSALRNNDEAIKTFARYFNTPEKFISKLLEQSTSSELLMKRRIGLLGALIVNDNFEEAIVNSNLDITMMNMFVETTSEALRTKIKNVLVDIEAKHSTPTEDEDETYILFKLIENRLSKLNEIDEEAGKLLANLLKFAKKNLTTWRKSVSPAFMEWLDNQMDQARESSTMDTNIAKHGHTDYVEYLSDIRHL